MIVLDGNMKNSRQICAATDAGFVEYDGFPGLVKTGCMNTPDQKGHFCAMHKPRQLLSDDCSGRIEMIVSKKTTRSTTFYQAQWTFQIIHTFIAYQMSVILKLFLPSDLLHVYTFNMHYR